MRIALGNDHAGLGLKPAVVDILVSLGHEIHDYGVQDETPVDFPDITFSTCDAVRRGEADRAVLVCGTGVGALIAANKIPGIRAGMGHDVYSAHQGVEHDDTNALCLGAWLIGPATARETLAAFLDARFDNDEATRRRVDKLRQMEINGARELAALV
ncbi:RpiB/LacA/LacB family sugar-phosphate isomerase [Streptomyces sp. IBSBF 2507]|uniref:RpiB/LacA/LacB family sugar-phosphate isomerase n=1 Tax=Streptomyces sp. IBSBF 2507 TaxID=2903530 RepID=UPI00351EC7AC